MPARRDYALVWRDSIVTLAQLPVAGLLASQYFSQQWVERSKTYTTRVVDRLLLARPAEAGPLDNVMTDVLTDDLAEAITSLVRDLVALPGQTAQYFNLRLETMINDVLTHIQPDAKTDVQAYINDQLDKLNRELSRLREVEGAETVRRAFRSSPGREAARGPQGNRGAAAPGRGLRKGSAAPRARMLLGLQAALNAAQTRFETKEAPARTSRGAGRAERRGQDQRGEGLSSATPPSDNGGGR